MTAAIIIGVLIVLLLVVLKPKEHTSSPNKTPTFVFFSADWCGHCTSFQPTWDKFVAQSPINTLQIKDEEIHKKFGVDSYPNLRLYFSEPVPGSNDFKPYTGDRSLKDLLEFVRKNIG